MQDLGKLGCTIRWPGKLRSDPKKRDQAKHCLFHDDFGHNTVDCFALKYKIGRLLSLGHVRRFIAQPNAAPNGSRQVDQTEPQMVRTINVIMSGWRESGTTYSAAKRSAHKVCSLTDRPGRTLAIEDKLEVTFSFREGIDILNPHHGALVISLGIANCLIKRLLVDNGSSVNIIYADTLKEMQVEETKLVR